MKQHVASSIENSTEAQPKMEAENGIRHRQAAQSPLTLFAYTRSLRKRCFFSVQRLRGFRQVVTQAFTCRKLN